MTTTREPNRMPTKKADRAKAKPKPIDPTMPLKPATHEKFAQLVFAGTSLTSAYRETYPKTRAKATTVHANASRLHSKILARIRWLQKQASDATIITVACRKMKLSQIARGTIAGASVSPADSMRAIDLLNRMDGVYDSAEPDTKSGVTVVIAGKALKAL